MLPPFLQPSYAFLSRFDNFRSGNPLRIVDPPPDATHWSNRVPWNQDLR
jgi:hypothetical protein